MGQNVLPLTDNIQNPLKSTDYLFGEDTQPSETRLSETTLHFPVTAVLNPCVATHNLVSKPVMYVVCSQSPADVITSLVSRRFTR